MSETHSDFYERWSAMARPYFGWQFAQFAPFVGKRAVDVGCALGSFVEHFLGHGVDAYYGVEIDPELRSRFLARHHDPRVRLTATQDATNPNLVEELRAARIDTAFSANVLEHIERDDLALRHMIHGVAPGGHICLLVPAHPFLFGTLDTLDKHYRRYTKASLRDLVARAGGDSVEWVDLYHFNLVASFGWFLKGRVLKETSQKSENFTLMNAILPFVSRAEKLVRPPFGMSLIAVLRRR